MLRIRRHDGGSTVSSSFSTSKALLRDDGEQKKLKRGRFQRRIVVSALCCAAVLLHFTFAATRNQTTTVTKLKQQKPKEEEITIYNHFDTSPNCKVRFKDPTVSLCYFIPYGKNFGDELGPAVVLKLLEHHFGCSAQNVSVINLAQGREQRENRTCLFSLGSIFHFIRSGDFVWGTGINPKWQKGYPKSLTTYSVRGPQTEALVRKNLRVPNTTVIGNGDPGFMIPFLYQEYKQTPEPKSKVCFIPHFHDQKLEQVLNQPPSKVKIISVQQTWRAVLEQIQNCARVASSSLHGLIIADSLGIPSLWFQFKDSKTASTEGDFKYREYYQSIGRSYIKTPESNFDNVFKANLYQAPLGLEQRQQIAKRTVASFPIQLFESSTNRTLVIILGNLRGGEIAWQTLYKNVLDQNNADLALCIGKVPIENQTSSLYKRAKYLWEFDEYDDWADAMDLIDGTKWRSVLLPHANVSKGLMGGVKGHKGSGAVIFMARWFLSQHLQKLKLTDRYSRFVLTRADHYYKCAHDITQMDPRYMWVPRLGEYGGVTDRHLVCNNQQILQALNIYQDIMEHPDLYKSAVRKFNPETLIFTRWKMQKLDLYVRWFDRTFFTCAVDGDSTRWREPTKLKVKEGVQLKYAIEYGAAHCTCGGGQPIEKTKTSVTCKK